MKADILRRVEEMDEEDRGSEVSDSELGIHRNKALDIAYEEELDEEDRVHVAGDGSAESDNDEGDDDVVGEVLTRKPAPETVLELTYLRDPKLFDRDGKTRRDNARTELKKQTGKPNIHFYHRLLQLACIGWGDEQIEGWKIMFERQPQAQRDKILQKHEFRGNRPLDAAPEGSGSGANHAHSGSANRGGAGRGGGGGGGRGRGGRGRGGGGGDDRAWKDKNKSSQANHNRKRGHDKKMARAGPPAM
jgi:activating signal cointegrator complex subunit 2